MGSPIACKAIEVLETNGWGQKKYYNTKTGAYCMIGALSHANYLLLEGSPGVHDDYHPLLGKIMRRIENNSIPAWNDQPGRTKEEVVNLLKEFC